ncbi:hypothetical protein FY034_17460 (plasmid) [Trichlorobacter lovleyi]|uniref:hypothetical protein n=1 Tax=Trichlorobacter lovleyi TaxID=313985 RepID=UPI00223EC6E6|nr:hypothetical protein [Trichlorobacter lovleyi]QOX80811.1 hypothetical protein FY034_17460 [Trichlorobacter lovleyi]
MLTITTKEEIEKGCSCGGEIKPSFLTEYACSKCGRQYATIDPAIISDATYECHDCGKEFFQDLDYDGDCPHCSSRNWAKQTGASHGWKVGDHVYWNDPDNHATSGFGTITHVQHNGDDAVISVAKDDGGEVEALPNELSDNRRYGGMAIIGRVPGDDEDSCYVYENMSESEALKAFEIEIYQDSTDTPDLIEKEHGVTIFHNMTLVSDSPITAI